MKQNELKKLGMQLEFNRWVKFKELNRNPTFNIGTKVRFKKDYTISKPLISNELRSAEDYIKKGSVGVISPRSERWVSTVTQVNIGNQELPLFFPELEEYLEII